MASEKACIEIIYSVLSPSWTSTTDSHKVTVQFVLGVSVDTPMPNSLSKPYVKRLFAVWAKRASGNGENEGVRKGDFRGDFRMARFQGKPDTSNWPFAAQTGVVVSDSPVASVLHLTRSGRSPLASFSTIAIGKYSASPAATACPSLIPWSDLPVMRLSRCAFRHAVRRRSPC